MSNGVKMGKGNTIFGDVTGTITIKKSHFAIGITLTLSIVLVLTIVLIFKGGGDISKKLLGKWVTENGEHVEFLSDGSIKTDLHSARDYNDLYEIMEDEGYLKWGIYNPAMINYDYIYWKMDLNGTKLTLKLKDEVYVNHLQYEEINLNKVD